MNKWLIGGGVALLILLGITGFTVYKVLAPQKIAEIPKDEEIDLTIPPVDSSVTVSLEKNFTKDSTVNLVVSHLQEKMATICYELSYETQGLIQGVNCGSKPVDVSKQNDYNKEIYLGTCSKSVCRPHTGVKKISLVLEFTDTSGKKFQFTKDFDL